MMLGRVQSERQRSNGQTASYYTGIIFQAGVHAVTVTRPVLAGDGISAGGEFFGAFTQLCKAL